MFAMSTHIQPTTADELLLLPDDGKRRELIAGELREMTPAGHEHIRVAVEVTSSSATYFYFEAKLKQSLNAGSRKVVIADSRNRT